MAETMTIVLDGEPLTDPFAAAPRKTGAPVQGTFDWQECLARVRLGEENAARELMNFLYPLIIKIVRYHLPRRTSEDDLTQTILMKVFSRLDSYTGQAPLEHWVSRVAVNTCLNELRAEKARPECRWADLTEAEERVVEILASETQEIDPGEELAARDLADKLLARLSPEDRLILRLMHMDGHSVEEVSKLTGWSGVLIKVRAFRARNKLRKYYEKLVKDHHES